MLTRHLDFNLLVNDPVSYLLTLLIGLITLAVAMSISIGIHELSHAYTANILGDPTAKSMGRLSRNPLAHLDPLGTLLIVVVGIGWGKSVPVNPFNLRWGRTKGMAVVSLAGPASNLIVAGIAALAFRLMLSGVHVSGDPSSVLGALDVNVLVFRLLRLLIILNLILAVFNLIPIGPLDGFRVALGVLPRELSARLAKTEDYGTLILLGIFALDLFLRINFFSRTIDFIVWDLSGLLVGP